MFSKKFKSLAETSWDKEEFYDEKIIEAKIKNKEDLFNRGHKFEYIDIDDSYPDYLINNKNKYSKWILNEMSLLCPDIRNRRSRLNL